MPWVCSDSPSFYGVCDSPHTWIEVDNDSTTGRVCNDADPSTPPDLSACQGRWHLLPNVPEANRAACSVEPSTTAFFGGCSAAGGEVVLGPQWGATGGSGGTGEEEPGTSTYLLPPLSTAEALELGGAMVVVLVIAWGIRQVLILMGSR